MSDNYLEFDSFVFLFTGVKCANCENVLYRCRESLANGSQLDEKGRPDYAVSATMWWNECAVANLRSYQDNRVLKLDRRWVCDTTVGKTDMADPFLVRATLAYRLSQLSPRNCKKAFGNGPVDPFWNMLEWIYTGKKLNGTQKMVLHFMVNTCNQLFEDYGSVWYPLEHYLHRAILAEYAHVPHCLGMMDTAGYARIARELAVPTDGNILTDIENEYFEMLMRKDSAMENKLRGLFHSLPNQCNGGYRMPVSWYLRDAWKHRKYNFDWQTHKEKMAEGDSIFATSLEQFLNRVNRKDEPDYFSRRGFYLRSRGRGGIDIMYQFPEFYDNALLYKNARADDLRWRSEGVKSPLLLFEDVLPVVIEDSSGYRMELNFYWPVRRARWGIGSIVKMEEMEQVGTLQNGAAHFTLNLIYILHYDTDLQAEEIAADMNYGDDLLILGVHSKADTVVVLLEVKISDPGAMRKQHKGRRKKDRSKSDAVRRE